MKKLFLIFLLLIATSSVQSQTSNSVLREMSLNISFDYKKGKEFFYSKEFRSIYDGEYIIVEKRKDETKSTNTKTVATSTGFKEKGRFKQGYKHGIWKTTYKRKVVKIEHWENGLIVGMYKVFNTNGDLLYEIMFKKTGTSKYKDYFYKSGQLKVEGNYVTGRKEGVWNYYNENGDKINTINYKQGVPN